MMALILDSVVNCDVCLLSMLGQLLSEPRDNFAVCHHWNSRLCHGVRWLHLSTGQGMYQSWIEDCFSAGLS